MQILEIIDELFYNAVKKIIMKNLLNKDFPGREIALDSDSKLTPTHSLEI